MDAFFGVRLLGASVVSAQGVNLAAGAEKYMAFSTRGAVWASNTARFSPGDCRATPEGGSGCWQPASRIGEHTRNNRREFRSILDIL